MSLYQASERWDRPTLDASAVARLLGISTSAVRQYLWSETTFPAPQTRGANGRNLWSPSVIYPYLRARHGRRRDRIPRLWSATELNPARFLGAQTVVLGQCGAWPSETFVVHEWRPSDEGGPLAIAYPVGAAGPRRDPRRAAVDLFGQLRGRYSAVAVSCSAAEAAELRVDVVGQPVVVVVDDGSIDAERVGDQAVVFGWSEVAWLLQADVPWWPEVLRDGDAILTWRPGDPVQRVMAFCGDYAAQPLLDLIAAADPPMPAPLRDVVAGLADDIAGDLARRAESEAREYPPRPGLIHAAVPAAGHANRGSGRRPRDVAALLHHRVADRMLAERAVGAVDARPVVTAVMVISPEVAADPLVGRWVAGLRPVPAEQLAEVGYCLLSRLRGWSGVDRGRRVTPVGQWCAHQSDPDSWAVITSGGTIYTTVGSAVPAGGRLQSVLVTGEASFFETTEGQVWPLPQLAGVGYNAGYGGAGPRALAQALSRLLGDAGADVEDPDGGVDDVAAVWEAVCAQHLPLRWTTPA